MRRSISVAAVLAVVVLAGATPAAAQLSGEHRQSLTVSFTSPVPNQVFRFTDPVPLRAEASAHRGVARVEFRVDGAVVANDTTAPYGATVTDLPAGQHVAQATAFDGGARPRAAAVQVRFWVDVAESPSINPYVGARVYVNPEWRARALAEPGGDRVADQPTAVWLDSTAAIQRSANAMGLAAHLDQAVIQAAGQPMVVQLVIYNLPGRNCGRMVSNGEFGPAELSRYKAEFIDPIAEVIERPAYANLRIVTIIEPDSLPNLVANTAPRPTATALCETMLANGGYVHGVGYALARLGALPNVFNYVDVSHHGVIGWEDDLVSTVGLLVRAALASGSTMANVRGFVTNAANYSALREPFIPMTDPYRFSKWVDFNQFNDEMTFAQAMRIRLAQAGFAPDIGFLVDTSRNGWGGPTRPLGPSTSLDPNTFVDESRIDRRVTKANYCNQAGAGLGERPTAAPADGIHAYAWIKPPGESDGPSVAILDEGFDRMCDPTYTGSPRASNIVTGALAGAPAAGVWFPAQFQELMRNAYPPL